jgi:hypothetical protein
MNCPKSRPACDNENASQYVQVPKYLRSNR